MKAKQTVERWRSRLWSVVHHRADSGGMDFRKVAIYLSIAFVLYWVMQRPAETADLFRDALGGVGDAAGRLAEFVRQMVR